MAVRVVSRNKLWKRGVSGYLAAKGKRKKKTQRMYNVERRQ